MAKGHPGVGISAFPQSRRCLERKSPQLHQRNALPMAEGTELKQLRKPGLPGITRMGSHIFPVPLVSSSLCYSWGAGALLGSDAPRGLCGVLQPKDCPRGGPEDPCRAPRGAPALPLCGALLTQGLLGGLEVTLPPSCSFRGWFGAGF